MENVFRLHNGNNNIVDWQNSAVIGQTDIKNIADPAGGKIDNEITSIPSPFARIDLVKSAFEEIDNNFNLDGDTIYHKMVSDSLDVGEILFNYERLGQNIDIVAWNIKDDLKSLLDSTDSNIKALGETLDMYIKQDGPTYNFEELTEIYLLKYTGPSSCQNDIIGATSPCTLFFSTANDLLHVSNNISFGNDHPFDRELQPLYKRDFEYIKYLWALKLSITNFSRLFSAFYSYLNKTYDKLTDAQKQELNKINKGTIDNYEKLEVNKTSLQFINGHYLRKKNIVIEEQSDFQIQTRIYDNSRKPLVLPENIGNSYDTLKYITSNWSNKYNVPPYDNLKLDERTLPGDGSKYPYLTIGDFLEDNIIKLNHKINSNFYFDGNFNKKSEYTYLLPIKKQFFEFFSVDDLKDNIAGTDTKMIEMSEHNKWVNIKLRIPIKGNDNNKFIEYSRTYYEESLPAKPKIINHNIGLGIFPAIKFTNNVSPNYRVAFFDKVGKVSIQFYDKNNSIKSKCIKREEYQGENINNISCSIESYIIEENFDRIDVDMGNIGNGIIIPKLPSINGTSQFTFAVDFGTTNTHIEYSQDRLPSRPFEINENDQQLQRLHSSELPAADIEVGFDDNFIPKVTEENKLDFPIRTAFSEGKNIDYKNNVHVLASGNIPFRYEKNPMPDYNNIRTDLKWSYADNDRVKLYIENLLLLMRNKVLLNNGDLAATKIVWFYPSSMTPNHRNRLKDIWNTLYEKHFKGDKNNIIMMSESVAPYHYYVSQKGAASANILTIDIGGGTTDIFVVENDQPKILSSIRFASNSIFGDKYGNTASNNGFINTFKKNFENTLVDSDLTELNDIYNKISSTNSSTDITTFFFSLKNSNKFKDKKPFDFLEELANNEYLKYPFIIFYSSIIYYVANLMKAKNCSMPSHVAFSGNGSKTLSVLSTDNNTLTNFVKKIIEKVYGKEYTNENNLTLIYENNPKVATCKGGIYKQDNNEYEDIKCSLLGNDNTTVISDKTIDDAKGLVKDIIKNVEEFIDIVFDLNKDKLFYTDFGANPAINEQVKQFCKQNLAQYTNAGLKELSDELSAWGDGANIKETLFFLPITGMLNNITRNISNIK